MAGDFIFKCPVCNFDINTSIVVDSIDDDVELDENSIEQVYKTFKQIPVEINDSVRLVDEPISTLIQAMADVGLKVISSTAAGPDGRAHICIDMTSGNSPDAMINPKCGVSAEIITDRKKPDGKPQLIIRWSIPNDLLDTTDEENI